MRKNLVVLQVCLCCLCFQAYSQKAPGYMGKHFSINYGIGLSPALINSSNAETVVIEDNGNARQDWASVNFSQRISVDYVLTKKKSVGLVFSFYHTKYDGKEYMDDYYRDPNSGSVFPTQFSEIPHGFYDISAKDFSVYIKMHTRNYVAPFGKYVRFDGVLRTFTTHYDPKDFFVEVDENKVSDFGSTYQTFLRPDLCFSVGKQRIAFDRLLIDYGCRVSIIGLASVPIFYATDAEDLSWGYNNPYDMDGYIGKTAAQRTRLFNTFSFYLNLGFLAF